MKLSGEQFQEIIASLISDDAEGGSDKRREPRVGIRAQGSVTPQALSDQGLRKTVVTIRDLSPGGICILSHTSMARGSQFMLDLPRLQGPALQALYEVRYSKVLAKDLFSVGAKLKNIKDTPSQARAGAA